MRTGTLQSVLYRVRRVCLVGWLGLVFYTVNLRYAWSWKKKKRRSRISVDCMKIKYSVLYIFSVRNIHARKICNPAQPRCRVHSVLCKLSLAVLYSTEGDYADWAGRRAGWLAWRAQGWGLAGWFPLPWCEGGREALAWVEGVYCTVLYCTV